MSRWTLLGNMDLNDLIIMIELKSKKIRQVNFLY